MQIKSFNLASEITNLWFVTSCYSQCVGESSTKSSHITHPNIGFSLIAKHLTRTTLTHFDVFPEIWITQKNNNKNHIANRTVDRYDAIVTSVDLVKQKQDKIHFYGPVTADRAESPFAKCLSSAPDGTTTPGAGWIWWIAADQSGGCSPCGRRGSRT